MAVSVNGSRAGRHQGTMPYVPHQLSYESKRKRDNISVISLAAPENKQPRIARTLDANANRGCKSATGLIVIQQGRDPNQFEADSLTLPEDRGRLINLPSTCGSQPLLSSRMALVVLGDLVTKVRGYIARRSEYSPRNPYSPQNSELQQS